jgi:hypothetical protein
MQDSPLAILQSANLYAYAVNNPIRYTDPSGMAVGAGALAGMTMPLVSRTASALATSTIAAANTAVSGVVFRQTRGGEWQFFEDDPAINTFLYGADVFFPFVSTSVFWITDRLTDTRTVTRHVLGDAIGMLSSSLGLYETGSIFASGGTALGRAAGNISRIISGANFINEIFSDTSYINQITGNMFNPQIRSSSFDEALNRFILFSVLTRELIDYGAITYTTSWGTAVHSVNNVLFERYFDDLGVTFSEYVDWIHDRARPTPSRRWW